MINIWKKYTTLDKETKAGLWFTVCSFVQKGINFIVVPIFTRIMTTEQYGLSALFSTWSSIIAIIATLNISGSVYNRGLVDHEEKKFTSIVQTVSLTASTITLALIVIFKDIIVDITGLKFEILLIMMLYIIFEVGLNLWMVKERFHYRYKKLIIVTLANTILSTAAAIIAVFCTEDKGIAKIIASTVVMIIFAFPFYVKNFIDGKKFFDKKIWKYISLFSLPLIPHYLSNIILSQSDKIMIDMFCGKSDVALYSVAYSIGSIVLVLTDSINNAMTPWRYQCLKKKEYKKIQSKSEKVLLFIACVVCAVNLFAPEILALFASADYMQAVNVIPPILLSIYFIFLYSFFSNVEFYYLKTKFIMIASLMSAGINILLNYLLIKKFGYEVCAYTTLFCYILYCVLHYIYMSKILKKEAGITNIYNIKRITTISILCSSVTLLVNMLYDKIIIRYTIIVVGSLFVIFYRKKLLKIIKRIIQNDV